MGVLIWFVIGGVLGWMASIMSRSQGDQILSVNVIVGVAGALLGGMVISPLAGLGDIENYGLSFTSVLIALGGAVLLLALVTRFRQGRRKAKPRR